METQHSPGSDYTGLPQDLQAMVRSLGQECPWSRYPDMPWYSRMPRPQARAALPGEWRLQPQAVQLIWGRFGAAQVDLFASPETTHCQEFYSLTEATLGTDALAHSWPRGLRKYAFPPVSLLAQTLCKIREDEEQLHIGPTGPGSRNSCSSRQPLPGQFL